MPCGEREAERARKRYLHRVARLLPLKRGERRRLLDRLRLSIGGELPDANDAELRARFGEPEEMAAAYADGWSSRELLRVMQIRQRAMLAILLAALVAILSLGGFLWSLLRQLPIDRSGNITAFEVTSAETLSDQELDALIRNSPEYAAAYGTTAGS